MSADTWVYLDRTVHEEQHRPGPGRCGCNPAHGDSCPSCTGESAEEWQQVKARRDEVRQQWRAGRLTARQHCALSAAVSSDGLPSRDAVEALARAEQRERAARPDENGAAA